MLAVLASCSGGGGPANTPTPPPSESPSPSPAAQLPAGLLRALEQFASQQGRDLVGPCESVPQSTVAGRHFCYEPPVVGAGTVTIKVAGPFSDDIYVLIFQPAEDGSFTLLSVTRPGGI
jgi:hypothetical protein